MKLLPKIYEDKNGLFPQHKGKPKGSYSQFSSYNDDEYRHDYYVQYFFGFDVGGNDFSLYGGNVGTYIQSIGEKWDEPERGCLSDEDIEFIHQMVKFPENTTYERELCIDFGWFTMEGYIDEDTTPEEMKIIINDYKTGNLDKKAEFYASEEYRQTRLYALEMHRQGYEILGCGVKMLGRKGSSLDGQGNFKMRLSGEHKYIPTPFTPEIGQEVEAYMIKTAENISKDYQLYKKFVS